MSLVSIYDVIEKKYDIGRIVSFDDLDKSRANIVIIISVMFYLCPASMIILCIYYVLGDMCNYIYKVSNSKSLGSIKNVCRPIEIR